MPETWRKCSSCKGDILTGQTYYVCSVSTCVGKVTNYAFCSVPCWDAHVPIERHRPESAGAIERKAPSVANAPAGLPARGMAASAPEGQRKILVSQPKSAPPSGGKSSVEDEILVVVSKVRKYIADRSGMNTSASVYDALTEKVKRLCDLAIEEARQQGRKTVMDRDVH